MIRCAANFNKHKTAFSHFIHFNDRLHPIAKAASVLQQEQEQQQQHDTGWTKNAEQLPYAQTAVVPVNKLTYSYAARDNCCSLSLIPADVGFGGADCRADTKRPWLPPYMEADIQRGIIDTSQLQTSASAAARWGGCVKKMAVGIMCWPESYCRLDVANGPSQLLKVGHTTSRIEMNHTGTKTACKKETNRHEAHLKKT